MSRKTAPSAAAKDTHPSILHGQAAARATLRKLRAGHPCGNPLPLFRKGGKTLENQP